MNKHVFEKIAKLGKTELSEVKVDLALVDDLANLGKEALQISKDLLASTSNADKMKMEMEKIKQQFDAEVKNVAKFYNAAAKFQTKESKVYEKANKAAQDLGLKIDAIPGFKAYWDNSMNVNSAINGANKYMA
jgi:hypothetical protein